MNTTTQAKTIRRGKDLREVQYGDLVDVVDITNYWSHSERVQEIIRKRGVTGIETVSKPHGQRVSYIFDNQGMVGWGNRELKHLMDSYQKTLPGPILSRIRGFFPRARGA